jgi:serine/threonine protein kinase
LQFSGDLKTFLLARRHLVTDRGSEENEEISSKKLTNMALDVARALTYLADLKYVHRYEQTNFVSMDNFQPQFFRDVACRNCMVNANRIVKLGDFGMTRAMYESDYYKFNRKGRKDGAEFSITFLTLSFQECCQYVGWHLRVSDWESSHHSPTFGRMACCSTKSSLSAASPSRA